MDPMQGILMYKSIFFFKKIRIRSLEEFNVLDKLFFLASSTYGFKGMQYCCSILNTRFYTHLLMHRKNLLIFKQKFDY